MMAQPTLDGLNLAEHFANVFREEHREIRDTLLTLIRSFETLDVAQAATNLRKVLEVMGPHFRYEEESMFPALTPLFGSEYVDRLLTEHDIAIGIAIRLDNAASQSEMTVAEGSRMASLIRSRLLPHVSDCDGLSIMVERLPYETISAILTARDLALSQGLDLFSWASRIRKRPAVLA